MSEVLAKCEEYHAWGVEITWIVDPEECRAWEYHKGRRLVEVARNASLSAAPLSLPLKDLFAGLA